MRALRQALGALAMKLVEFAVPGTPQPKGSMRAIPMKAADGSLKVGMKNDNPKTKEWQDLVSWSAKSAMGSKTIQVGPIMISVTFSCPRPPSHLTKYGVLRQGIELEMTYKPDLDKLVRCVLDALTGICYEDDCQVTTVVASKFFAGLGAVADFSGVNIRVEAL